MPVVKVLALPGLEWKKSHGPDVSDWLLQGGTRDELEALANDCPEWAPPSAPQGAAGFPETDAGNGELFAHLYGDRVRYDWQLQRWLVWGGHRWVPDADGELYRLSIEAARVRARDAADLDGAAGKRAFDYARGNESVARIRAMLDIAKALPPISDNGLGWDANPLLLGCTNGVVNLATGELRPGRREDRITMTTGVAYDPAAPAELWGKFLEQVFDGDLEMLAFIRRMAGYGLTGLTREQVWFLAHGSGANGKSTWIETVAGAMGDYAGDTPSETLCARGGFSAEGPSPFVAALVGKRLVMCSETEEMGKVNASRVKWLTGGNPVTARMLRGSPFTFQPQLKLVLTTNHLPRVDDESEGFWRRVRLLPFLKTFSGESRDDSLKDRLRDEHAGILAWAVRGAIEVLRDGLKPPTSVMMATWRYRQDSDPLAEFITDCCVIGEGERVEPAVIYRVYKGWCERQGYREKDVWSQRYLGNRLAPRFPRVPSNGKRWHMGIRVLREGEERSVTEVTDSQNQSDGKQRHSGSSLGEKSLAWDEPNLVSLPSLPSLQRQTAETRELGCSCHECVDEAGETDCPDWFDLDDGSHCRQHHPHTDMEI